MTKNERRRAIWDPPPVNGATLVTVADRGCKASTGVDTAALKELNNAYKGSARDLMDEEQLAVDEFFKRQVILRAKRQGREADFTEIAVEVQLQLAPFTVQATGATPFEVVKKNKEEMKTDLVLTRPLNLERFNFSGRKKIKSAEALS
eukprot:jgi/Mesvir1/20415/Mv12319-RA.1